MLEHFRGRPATGKLGAIRTPTRLTREDDGRVAKARKWTERTLVKGCRRGDRQAQRALYEGTSERIFRLLLKLTRNRDDALDLAQTTYLRAFAQIDRFDGRSALITWLYRIATNEALQFTRHNSVEQRAMLSIAARAEKPSENPENLTRLDVADALATLPAEDRTLAVLRFEEGLDYAAIAAVMGCPVGTVASRLNTLRRKLRSLLLRGGYGQIEESGVAEHQTIQGSTGAGDCRQALPSRAGGSREAP